MVAPGVCHGEGLEDAADRLAGFGPDQKMEVVGHEAVAEEPNGVAVLGAVQRNEEGFAIVVLGEDIAAIVAAIERMVDQPLVDGSW